MASSNENPNLCLMCLETPAVREVGVCQHSFCEGCFTAHKMVDEDEKRPCPACQKKSQEPDSGYDGIEPGLRVGGSRPSRGEEAIILTDDAEQPITSGGDDGTKQDLSGGVIRPSGENEAAAQWKEQPTCNAVGDEKPDTGRPCRTCGQIAARHLPAYSNCVLCYYGGTTKEAANICEECKKLPLCGSCTDAHRRRKATQHHVVTALAPSVSLKREDMCGVHGQQRDLLCKTCSADVCHVCVSLEHSDHDVEPYIDMIHDEVNKVKAGLEFEKSRFETLQADERYLEETKATGEVMEDSLIKSIEDHAEKCIEEILKNKEVLKKSVREDFEVVRVMRKRLQASPDLLTKSKRAIAVASELLNQRAELNSTYVEKFVDLRIQLDQLKDDHPAYEEDRDKYRKDYDDLCEKTITFYPRTPNCKIGGLTHPGPRCDDGGPCVCDRCEKAFKWPDISREDECRGQQGCKCGTCGCQFKRYELMGFGQ